MRVYIAGPYTLDPEACVRNAIDAGHRVLDLGHEPFIPHLAHYAHAVRERDYEDWLRLDLAWLEVADAVLRLPGHSPGADREVARATELGIPVVYDLADLWLVHDGG